MTKIIICLALCLTVFMSTRSLYAIALGGGAGTDLPLAHSDSAEEGFAAEGFFRQDPYELRFHFGDTGKVNSYSVLLSMKHFISQTVARPYIEGGIGPVIVNSEGKGMSYGVKPEASLGVDIGVNTNFSVGVAFRYYGLAYFGSTYSGKFEANHGFSLLGNLIVWF